ncbi:MAG: phosphotransferase [Thiomonas sp.]|uniref:aminoglycoside phosphotransferase family protein n=1 Tax=Thiomonas sp. TaxID=2047785 RepID=UPI002A361FA3|nr:phosphotransferase [Thiomonas sp.]MDY0330579.1 phosphotransferase [Thiomonas sp.]
MSVTDPNARAQALQHWLQGVAAAHPLQPETLQPASSDASFRRYFRVRADEGSLIVMDAPPPMENVRPFVRVSQLLADGGVQVPRVLEQDVDQGFLLLTDLGQTTYLQAISARHERADGLMRDALGALVTLQRIDGAGVVPTYDAALLRRELDLFPEWFVQRHHGHALTEAQRAALQDIFSALIANNLAQPRVLVHRDWHSRNLMVTPERNPGVLDFQDAVIGPITYDLVSLLRDAYIAWPEEQQLDWAIRYWERARKSGLPVAPDAADFYRDLDWMGLQRALKVLGIFARLHHRDGKAQYLRDLPVVLQHTRLVAARYGAFKPLLRLLDQIEQRSPLVGYTF